MLESVSDIADVFSVFHDGEIVSHFQQGSDLRLRLDVEYLARRIKSSFKFFDVELFAVEDIEFTTWPDRDDQPPRQLHNLEEILTPRLEVLSGEAEAPVVRVVCNQPATRLGYSGGDLCFVARAAIVLDEAGLEWPIGDLKSLANAYWKEFSERGNRHAT